MADPTKYTPSFDFSDYQASNPKNPLPGTQIDIQMQDIAEKIGETVDAIKDVRRSDGKLKNRIVTRESLDPVTLNVLLPNGVPSIDELPLEEAPTRDDTLVLDVDGEAKSLKVGALSNLLSSDAVSQGNVPIYGTAVGVAALNIPVGINAFRTNGYYAAGDGGGALYVEGVEAVGAIQSGDGRWWELSELLPNVLQFGYRAGIATSDNDDCLDAALEYAAGGGLFTPASEDKYLVTRTHIVPPNITMIGGGRYDQWDMGVRIGTTYETSGAGNPQRWTDITGADAADDTPMFVAGGNGVYFENLTLRTDAAQPWSIGAFFPSVKQCGIRNFSAFGFTDGCVYLDATWSDRNTTLKALHPNVVPSTGMNEFSAFDFWMIGGAGGFALKAQGTTRAGDSVATSADWLWGWGGISDVRFEHGRLSGTSAAGGAFSHDAQLFGVGVYAQGFTIRDTSFRGNGAGYSAKLDRSNRIIFDGCYGEDVGGGAHKFAITSRTQSSADGIIRTNDKLNVPLYINEVDTGFTGSTAPWRISRCMVVYRADGREYTQNFESSRSSGNTHRFTSFSASGQMRFAYDDGASATDYLRLQNDVIRPEVAGGMSLGSSTFPWGRTSTLFSNLLARATATIVAGVATASQSNMRFDTEAGAAADDLDTINGGADGDLLILSTVSNSRDVTVRDGTGNIFLASDCVLGSTRDRLVLMRTGTEWVEISRAING